MILKKIAASTCVLSIGMLLAVPTPARAQAQHAHAAVA